jgi:hypothetical protein
MVKASAVIWVRTVVEPWPMSTIPIWTTMVPSSRIWRLTAVGLGKPGGVIE